MGPTSLHERAQDFQEVLGGALLGGRRLLCRIEDVLAHVVLDDLGHQPGQRATARGDGLQDGEALLAPVEQALDAVDLSADALDSQEKLVAISLRVFHTMGEYSICRPWLPDRSSTIRASPTSTRERVAF